MSAPAIRMRYAVPTNQSVKEDLKEQDLAHGEMMSEESNSRNLSASRRPTTTCMLHENTGRGCIDCLAIDERDVTVGFYSGTNETEYA